MSFLFFIFILKNKSALYTTQKVLWTEVYCKRKQFALKWIGGSDYLETSGVLYKAAFKHLFFQPYSWVGV